MHVMVLVDSQLVLQVVEDSVGNKKMWQFLVLSLVLFDSGHSFPRLEYKNQDVYEVIEDKSKNTLKFVNPESSKPVLREITYYHLVEKPYHEHDTDTVNSLDAEPNRFKTNGHGYQYLDPAPVSSEAEKSAENDSNVIDYLLLEPDYDNGELDETTLEKLESKDAESDPTETIETTTAEVEESAFERNPEAGEEGTTETKETGTTEPTPEVEKSGTIEPTPETQELETAEPTLEAEESRTKEPVPEETEMLPDLTSELLIEAAKEMRLNSSEPSTTSQEATETTLLGDTQPPTMNDRLRRLFESEEKLKDRYLNMMHLFPSVKDKESANPTSSIPSSFLKSNARRKRSARITRQIPEAPTLPELDYSILPPEIRRALSADKLDQPSVTASMSDYQNPESLRPDLEPQDDSLRTIEMADGVVNMKANRPRTYGMNLTNDHGYVWNNLWSNPGMSFSVGELETVDESGEESQGEEPSGTGAEVPEVMVPETEPEVVVPESEPEPEVQEGSVDKEEPAKEEGAKPEETEEDLSDILVVDKNKQPVPEEEPAVEEAAVVEKAAEEAAVENPDESSEKPKAIPLDDEDSERVPETLKDLMSNRKFLGWLSDWTSEYMELVVKHMSQIVKEEISKVQEAIQSNGPNNLDNKLSEAIEAAAAEINEKPEIPKVSETEVSGTTTLKPEEDQIEELDDVSNIFIDGQQLPVSDESKSDLSDPNIDTFLRRNKHINNEESDKGVKVEANNVFGNAFGTEKVTNLFFFFVKDKKDMLNDIIKPYINKDESKVDDKILIDERLKETDSKIQSVPQEEKHEIEAGVTESPVEDAKDSQSNMDLDNASLDQPTPTEPVIAEIEAIENVEASSEVPAVTEQVPEKSYSNIQPVVEDNVENIESDAQEIPSNVEINSSEAPPAIAEFTTEQAKEIQVNEKAENQPQLEQIADKPEAIEEPVSESEATTLESQEPNAPEDIAVTSTTEVPANADEPVIADEIKNVEVKEEEQPAVDSEAAISETQEVKEIAPNEPEDITSTTDAVSNAEAPLKADEIKTEEVQPVSESEAAISEPQEVKETEPNAETKIEPSGTTEVLADVEELPVIDEIKTEEVKEESGDSASEKAVVNAAELLDTTPKEEVAISA